MKCPKCGGESKVLETRVAAKGDGLRRRRLCACGVRFTTEERYVEKREQKEAIPKLEIKAVHKRPPRRIEWFDDDSENYLPEA